MVRCFTTSTTGAIAGEISSTYCTHLGNVILTWKRGSIGFKLQVDFYLIPPPLQVDDDDNQVSDHLCIKFRPYISWKQKGSKHHQFVSATGRRRSVQLFWDLTLATFSHRGPEPTAGFFLSIVVDGEIVLVIGDRDEDAYRICGAKRPGVVGKGSELIALRENVRFGRIGSKMSYATKGMFKGEEMEISISIDVAEDDLKLWINGAIVLEVRRLFWKFRGNDEVALKKGGMIHVSWDLYDWFFQPEIGLERSPTVMGETGEAVFVLRFESGEGKQASIGRREGGAVIDRRGEFWKKTWSDNSSVSWSGSSSSELECCEEDELPIFSSGFTLFVCGRKN